MSRQSSVFANFLSRSVVPKAGLGNLLIGGAKPKGPGPKVATMNVSWNSPGQPQILDQDAQFFGEDAYLNQVYVMRCVQTIANTISGLMFRAGTDPEDPANYDPSAPLAQLLGPATPQAPGGPNPETASRAFWAWTICQYIVYGRFAWECQLDGKEIVALWPLVSACISAVPSQGGTKWFDSYVYTTPMAGNLTLKDEQVIYAWRPSITDWRVPETVLSAAKLPIYIAKGLDRYMVKLLQNDMVASTLVVTPPFEEPSARRAWQEQFLTSFSGVDNRGKTIFAEAEYDEDDTSGKPLVQVEKIAQTAVEAVLPEIAKTAKDEICVALGVPLSLIGNAQERIYANAQSEYKNFWVLTIINLLDELQDKVNTVLAPRLGQEVGWFDLSRVAALQPPPIFTPPMIGDAIQSGVATAAQIANLLGIPAADSTKDADTDTVEIGEESSSTGASMGANRSWKGTRVTREQLISSRMRYETRALNTYNWDEPYYASKWLRQEHIEVRTPVEKPKPITLRLVDSTEANELVYRVNIIRDQVEQHRLEQRKHKTAALLASTSEYSTRMNAAIAALEKREGPKAKAAAVTSPTEWHNGSGPSPHGSKEQFIRHFIDKHGVTNVSASMSRDFLDQWHAADHNQWGEHGAHQQQQRNAWLPIQALATQPCDYCDHPSTLIHSSTGIKPIYTCAAHASDGQAAANPDDDRSFPPTIRPMAAGQDFDEWYEQNEEALVGAVAGA